MQPRAKKPEGGSNAGLFEPDILLPNQYFAAFKRGRAVEGERRLMLAVLEDGVDSYRKHAVARDPRDQACFLEAKEWFLSDDRSWLFAFENICDVLEMNADYLRSGLDRWRRSLVAEMTAREAAAEAEAEVATEYVMEPQTATA